jgi:enamine deaminase RidA (YjgF/YER057c/UK114 family)
MPEYASPLNAFGLRCVNSSGLGERLSSLLHISGAVIIPPNASTVVTSGQTGYSTDMTYPSDLKEEVMNAFQNVEDQLTAAGVKNGFKSVYRMTSYHTDMGDAMLEALDAATEKYFGKNRPAWAGVGTTDLYGGARIEITAMAILAVEDS